jgi:hypothetical protein
MNPLGLMSRTLYRLTGIPVPMPHDGALSRLAELLQRLATSLAGRLP